MMRSNMCIYIYIHMYTTKIHTVIPLFPIWETIASIALIVGRVRVPSSLQRHHHLDSVWRTHSSSFGRQPNASSYRWSPKNGVNEWCWCISLYFQLRENTIHHNHKIKVVSAFSDSPKNIQSHKSLAITIHWDNFDFLNHRRVIEKSIKDHLSG